MKDLVRKVKKILTNKFISLGLIPLILIVFWVLASLILNNKVNFSVLLYQQSKNNIKIISGNLNKENNISGRFKANDNNLGLIMVRFNVYSPGSEDIITFKIKQEGDLNWYHVNSYRANLLTSGQLLPLGFPVIKNSKGKFYQFEILSNNKARIEDFNFLAGYEFSKNELVSNKGEGIGFLLKKTYTSFTNLDFILSSLVYLIPLFSYIVLCLILYFWRIKNSGYLYVVIPLSLIYSDIFIVKEFYLAVLVLLIIIWLYSFSKMKLESKVNFILAFVLILIWVILILLRVTDFQNKINIWTYSFLVMGVLTAVIEEKNTKKG
jgi:hypothetical protein